MGFLDKILEIIKQKNNGEDLNVKDNEYHVFLKDAHVLVYLDTETKTLKVEVEMFDEGSAKVFFEDVKLEELM